MEEIKIQNIINMKYNENITVNKKNDRKNTEEKQSVQIDENIKFENAFNKVKHYVEINDTKLSLHYDKKNKEPVIYVLDKETDEVIRRVPPEKLIDISGDQEKMKGLFFQKDV